MSLKSKFTLGSTIFLSVGIIGYISYQQKTEKYVCECVYVENIRNFDKQPFFFCGDFQREIIQRRDKRCAAATTTKNPKYLCIATANRIDT